MDSLRGSLLVAGPSLVDPNFHRVVVLVCEHSEGGALGLVLNRPSPLTVSEAVPELKDALGSDEVLWMGGPVQPASVIVLAEFDDESDGDGIPVSGEIGLVTAQTGLDELALLTRRARAFLGYTGWGPGQLDSELADDDWIVAPLDGVDPLGEDTLGLWPETLNRLGGSYALVARMPLDPSLN